MVLKHISGRLAAYAWLIFMACLMQGGVAMAETMPSKGDQLANEGNYKAAVQAFAAARKAAPDDAEITAKLARATLKAGEHKQAVDWAHKAVDLDPDKATYRMLLADAYANYVNDVGMFSKLGIAHKIRDAYLKAVELEPDNATAHLSLARFYLMAPGIAGGSDSEGERQLQILVRLDPAMAYVVRARQAANDKSYAKAEDWLRKAITVAKDADGYLALGQLLAFRDHPEDALNAYRKAVATYPDEPGAQYQIGRLAAMGKVDAQTGIKALRMYVSMPIDWRSGDAPLCWAHYRLAQILERQGDVQKAKDQYQQALNLNPDFPEARQAVLKLAASLRAVGSAAEQRAQAHS